MKHIILIGLMLGGCSKPAPLSPPQLVRNTIVSSLDGLENDYFVFLPEGYDQTRRPWPVILFLHGDGERGNGKDELDYVLIHGPLYEAWVQKRNLPFIIVSPQLPMFGRDTIGLDYLSHRDPSSIPKRLDQGVPPRPLESTIEEEMTGAEAADSLPYITLESGWDLIEDDLLTMIEQVLKEYRADPDRLYLTGLSYGGFGTWYMASKHPKLFAAINPIVGWGHPDLMPPIAQNQLPTWVFAGGRDFVVPKSRFFPGVNHLEKLGLTDLRFTIEEDMGHDVWKRVYSGEDLYTWLLSHSKQKGG